MKIFMASLQTAVSQSTSYGEVLSEILGSVSMTAWICLLLPQLITNFKTRSADGLSMGFLFIWLLGDVTNLAGAFFTKLAPTAIIIGCYFLVADLFLIAQCLYYNALNARRRPQAEQKRRPRSASEEIDSTDVLSVPATQHTPLLQRHDSGGLPGSHRRHSIRPGGESNVDPLKRIVAGEDETPDSNPWLHNALSLLAVWAVGVAGWFVSYKVGAWDADEVEVPDGAATGAVSTFGLGLGYTSAVCYLCARIPQIIKNYRQKSCDGLALLFFLLSLTGNLTYGASIMAFSQERKYLVRALPWLLGSLGTMVEDCIIFVQFRLYAPDRQSKVGDRARAASLGLGP